MAYFCYQCGSPLEENAVECSRCGAAVRQHRKAAENRTQGSRKRSYRKKSPFPVAKLLMGAAVLIACIVTLILLLGGKKTIDLNKYLDVSFSGYDGYGTAVVTFDRDRFYRENSSRIKAKTTNALESYLDPTEALLLTCLNGQLDKDNLLRNGEQITYVWRCKDDEAKEIYGVELKHSDMSFTVKGLEAVKTFDAFADLEITVGGSNGYGTVQMTNKAGASSPSHDLNYTVDQDRRLSNGDTVTVSISYGWYRDGDIAQAMLQQYGMVPAQLEKSFTISGLSDSEVFDPFDYIEFHLSGVSGDGEITAVVLRDEKVMEDASVSFDNNWYLANGDTVHATVNFGYTYDQTEMAETLAAEFGMVPTRFEKEIIIDSLPHYVEDINDLSPAAEQTMKQQLEDTVRSNAAATWGNYEHLNSMNHVGTYVLHKKDSQAYGWDNHVILVYQIHAAVIIPEEGINKEFSYYYVLDCYDAAIDANGSFYSGNYEPMWEYTSYEPDIPGHNYWYTGYADLQQIYNQYVGKNLVNYSVSASGELPMP